MDKEIRELLRQIVGELVWGGTRGHGTVIFLEFGAPHLVVREPIKSKSTMSRVVRHMARRRVSIRGDFSLFIEDSRWSISVTDETVSLDSSEATVREVLQDLDGQRVSSVRFDAADTILEFDLGATIRLGKSIFPTEPKSSLWSLKKFGDPGIFVLNNGSLVRGDEAPS
jgi:hypothetical protein